MDNISAASSSTAAFNAFQPQLDLFGPPAGAGAAPFVGLEVKPTSACRQCGGSVAIVGPGVGPHCASLRCRSCDFHSGWLSRAHCTFLIEVINEAGVPPRQPIALPHFKTGKDDAGPNVVRSGMRKD